MPDRIVREALLRSDRWHALHSAEAQNLFIRLLLQADDFGVFDGREQVIATVCYPMGGIGPDEYKLVSQWIADMHAADLIVRFHNRERPYIGIRQWGNTLRYHRRFPAAPVNLDVRDIVYRGKYGKKMDWRNPDGSDDVSILLDLQGRPAVPQPPEWRRVRSDWMPITLSAVTDAHEVKRTSVTEPAVSAVTGDTPEPAAQSLLTGLGVDGKGKGIEKGVGVGDGEGDGSRVVQSLPTSTPATSTDDEQSITFERGAFVGLSEAQRLKWQDMFATLSVPDQVDRAAAWLATAEPAQRAASLAAGAGNFLVRWLLRESRHSTGDSRKAADA